MLINEKLSASTNCQPEEENSLIFESLLGDQKSEDEEWEYECVDVKLDTLNKNLDLPTIRLVNI